ncbi:RelA/SpoT domain-containing protein [Arenibacter latericius]|uniref:RelA/SpoT domain-containing protein n=1 Tax=Arenibacter latericius TaxID=86104 RepID=UPI00042942C0|nr:RelA/SpoT domain-containing protein [Arenibacter latericius]
MKYTGGDIKRLGNRLRDSKGKHISDADLDLLQAHRLSFTEPLFRVFKDLTRYKIGVERSAIIAFRLKRISTIINKTIRKPQMQLNRMWDVAGIRIIFNNEVAVRKMLSIISDNYEVRGEPRDRFNNPKKIGYRAIHVYITDSISGKVIEVQLRTRETHNWATLVEITDVLYGTRLKEEGYDSDKEWGYFHQLVSSNRQLIEDEANFLYKKLDKHDFISKLAETFRHNSSIVKKQWQNVQHKDKYFLIELSSNSVPKLSSYSNYEKAEADYFDLYKKDEGALIVLTSIDKPSFEQISIAYANYILSYHKFIRDVQEILKELAIEKLEDKSFKEFRKIFRLYEDIQANNIINILIERDDVIVNIEGKSLRLESNSKISTKKRKEIRKQINTGILDLATRHKTFMAEIKGVYKTLPLWAWKTKSFLNRHERRVSKRLKSIELKFDKN